MWKNTISGKYTIVIKRLTWHNKKGKVKNILKNEENQDGTFKSVAEKIDEVDEQAGSYEMGSTEDIDSIIYSLE